MEWKQFASVPVFILNRVWGKDQSLWPNRMDDPRVEQAIRANDEFCKGLKRA